MGFSNMGGESSHNVSTVPSTSKSNNQKQFRSLHELAEVVNVLVAEAAGASLTEVASRVLDCLSTFKSESETLSETNDCNYEEAYVHYKLASALLTVVIPHTPDFATAKPEMRQMIRDLTTQTLRFSKQLDTIKQVIVASNRQNLSMAVSAGAASPTADPSELLRRLEKVKQTSSKTPMLFPSSLSSFSTPLVPSTRTNEAYTHLALATPKNGVVCTPVRTVLLHSIPRSRSQSPSLSGPPGLVAPSPVELYFANLYLELQKGNPSSGRGFRSINPERLKQALGAFPQKVLLMDVRNRYQFTSLRIRFSNTINIEPLAIRMCHTDLQLEQTLVTSPEAERRLFDTRFDFDLIVLLGADDVPNTDLAKLYTLLCGVPFNPRNAGRVLKRHPVVLQGGINHWARLYPTAVHAEPPPPSGSTRFSSVIDDEDETMSEAMDDVGRIDPIPSIKRTSMRKQSASNSFSSVDSGYHRDLTQYLTETHDPLPLTPPMAKKLPHMPEGSGLGPRQASPGKPPSLPHRVLPEVKLAAKSLGDETKSPAKGPIDISKLLVEFTCGLKNLGNSCYMNCIIQCLSGTPTLITFFLNGSFKNHINTANRLGSGGVMSTSFKDLERLMISNDNGYVIPSEFKKLLGSLNRQFRDYDQQDCIELLDYLLDTLHEDLNTANRESSKAFLQLTDQEEMQRELLPVRLASTIEWERYLKLNFSIIVDLFQGQYYSQLRCLACNTTSTTYNAFSILSLPIPEETSTHPISLERCLDEFCATEVLDGDDRWNCVRCKTPQRSTKRLQITRLPNVIIIHFKRFKMNYQMSKLNTMITYPVEEVLDLTRYWPAVVDAAEQTRLAGLPTRNQTPPFRYQLYGVANHFGNLQNGHYTAFVEKGPHHRWCQFDDTGVTKNVKPLKVLNENAYCLFYKRV